MTQSDSPAPFEVAARGAMVLGIGQVILLLGLGLFGAIRARGDGSALLSWIGFALLIAVLVGGLSSHRRDGKFGSRWALGLLVLGAILAMFSPQFVWLQFPIWLIAAQALPLRVALPATGASLSCLISVLVSRNSSSAAVIGPIVGALVAFGVARGVLLLQSEARRSRHLLQQVLAAQAETAALSDEVARAQRESGVLQERTRLAREIHDTLAQGFSSILLLSRAAQRSGDPAQAKGLLADIEATAAENLDEARRVVHALDPPQLAGGLGTPLRKLADELSRRTGAEVSLTLDPDLPRLPALDEITMLRAAQGLFANVRTHAQATRVEVSLSRADDLVRLDVIDDGSGFDSSAPVTPGPTGGYGLTALRSRLQESGGGLAIDAEPGSGTTASAWLPTRGSQ